MSMLLQLLQQAIELCNHKDFNPALKIGCTLENALSNRLHSENKLSSLDRHINTQLSVLKTLNFDETYDGLFLEKNAQLKSLYRLKVATYLDVATVLIRVINDYQMLTNLPIPSSFRVFVSNYFCFLRNQNKSGYLNSKYNERVAKRFD